MAQTTITEALAEIPTIEKRIEKKSEFILNYLYRRTARVSASRTRAGFSSDYVVNVNERELAEKIENLENILGTSQPFKNPQRKAEPRKLKVFSLKAEH